MLNIEGLVILTTSFYDMNHKIFKKMLFLKFQLILIILRLQVIHDYVYWHGSIEYCV